MASSRDTASRALGAAASGRARLAHARARRRQRSAGAAMFIVAVTLGLLAAMGVYGLSATAYDIRAAGHMREAAQVQHAAEQAIVMTAETLSPGTAGEVVRVMQSDPTAALRQNNRHCRTAKPLSAGVADQVASRVAEACLTLSPSEMSTLHPLTAKRSPDANPKQGRWFGPVFTNKSLGDVPLHPFLRVELTNPIDWDTPPGFATSSPFGRPPIFTQIRATVFVELRPGTDMDDARDKNPAQAVAAGRGRLVVGPYTP